MRSLTTILLAAVAVSAQDKFEVVSIKPAAPRTSADTMITGAVRGGPGTESPEQFFWRAGTLGQIIRQAYELKSLQLIAPTWVNAFGSDGLRFDIAASLAPGTTRSQMNVMLRNLLTERFGLRFHMEMREISAYTLNVAKGGPKLTPSAYADGGLQGGGGPRPGGSAVLRLRAGATADIANMLEVIALRGENAVVVDKTGLQGKFDFEIQYAGTAVGATDSSFPMLATVLEQDLGLRLEKGKTEVEVLVVDQINKVPTEN